MWSGDTQVALRILQCGITLPPMIMLLNAQKSANISPFSFIRFSGFYFYLQGSMEAISGNDDLKSWHMLSPILRAFWTLNESSRHCIYNDVIEA